MADQIKEILMDIEIEVVEEETMEIKMDILDEERLEVELDGIEEYVPDPSMIASVAETQAMISDYYGGGE